MKKKKKKKKKKAKVVVTLYLSGEITHENKEEFFKDLDAIVFSGEKIDELLISIDSIGGNLDCAFGIYDRLRRLPMKVHTIVEGGAASAAAIILLAGDKRSISEHSTVMVHMPFQRVEGNVEEEFSERMAKGLKKIRKKIVNIIHERTSQRKKQIFADMNKVRELEAEEALECGYVHEIL